MSELSHDDILRLGQLARLRLTDEEQGRFAGQLSAVVEYVDELSKVDVSGVGERRGISGLSTVLADDAVRPSGDPLDVPREALLAGAPAHADGLITVRAVLGDEMLSA